MVDRHWFGFSVTVECAFVSVSGSQSTGFSCRGIEIDRVKIKIKLGFSDGVEDNIVFMCRIEIDLVLASELNFTCFRAGVKIDFGFVCGRKNTWLNLWNEIDLIFSVGIDIDLDFVCGTNMACFLCEDRST